MDARLRDRLALGVAVLAVAAGMAAFLTGADAGVRIVPSEGRLVVFNVEPGSPAANAGIREGMTVLDVNETSLFVYPQPTYPNGEPQYDPETGEEIGQTEVVWIPATITPIDIDDESLQALADQRITSITAIRPDELERGTPDVGWNAAQLWFWPWELEGAGVSFVAGLLLFGAGTWLLMTGRAGSALRDLAIPLALATAAPFLLRPLDVLWYPLATAAIGVLLPLAMVPLAHALTERIDGEDERRLLALLMTGITGLAIVAGLAMAFGRSQPTEWVWWALVGCIALFPGLSAAGPVNTERLRGEASSSGRLLQSAEFAVAGATPILALLSPANQPLFVPFSLWLLAVAGASRFTIRPLARLATRAQLQRDLVVAATEAERARVAADIHDDALQELTLLVRRLDQAGDAEGAEIARTISDRLRAICGDLRLPILDDLGVGPALDWLVLRIERLAGGEVRLERNDSSRPPADVELAFFRVAQEALSNAVKHGGTPIVVRYQATESGVSLSVDDAGPGIAPDAGTSAEQGGRFGLLNMQQRAEQIGAILDIRRWPGGGTHVALEWRRR